MSELLRECREFVEEARSGHITGSAHSIRYGEKRVALLERIDAALASSEAMPEYPAIHVDVHGGKRVWKHEYDALRAYAMRSADMAASNLIDRALKMMECAGYRVAAANPDHNNPIIAWMADARAYLSSAEAMPEPSAEAVREACAVAAERVTPRHTECGNRIAAAIRALKVG